MIGNYMIIFYSKTGLLLWKADEPAKCCDWARSSPVSMLWNFSRFSRTQIK